MENESITSDDPFMKRLKSFLSDYRSLANKTDPPALTARLQRLLPNLKPFLDDTRKRERRPVPVVVLDLNKLAELFGNLHPLLTNARQRGDLIDIWSIAGLKRDEGRNSAVLAWLLKPRGSHGQGHDILKAFLKLAAGQKGWVFDDANLAKATIRTEHYPLGDSENRIDIVIDAPDFIAFIEVKIDANEGHHQLERYKDALKRKREAHQMRKAYLIYLSPRAPHPNDSPSLVVDNENFAHITWAQVKTILTSDKTKHHERTHSQRLIRSFGHHIQHFI